MGNIVGTPGTSVLATVPDGSPSPANLNSTLQLILDDIATLEAGQTTGTYSGDILSVKSAPYNAAGNGTTDDTTAIQNCINDAIAQDKVAYFPAGTYRTTAAITWSGEAPRIIGAGSQRTTIKPDSNTAYHGLVLSGNNGSRGYLRDLSIIGPTAWPTKQANVISGLRIVACRQLEVSNVTVEKFDVAVDMLNNCFGTIFYNVGGKSDFNNVGFNIRTEVTGDGGPHAGNDLQYINSWLGGRNGAVWIGPGATGHMFMGGQFSSGVGQGADDAATMNDRGCIVVGKDYEDGFLGGVGVVTFQNIDFEGVQNGWFVKLWKHGNLNFIGNRFLANGTYPALGLIHSVDTDDTFWRISLTGNIVSNDFSLPNGKMIDLNLVNSSAMIEEYGNTYISLNLDCDHDTVQANGKTGANNLPLSLLSGIANRALATFVRSSMVHELKGGVLYRHNGTTRERCTDFATAFATATGATDPYSLFTWASDDGSYTTEEAQDAAASLLTTGTHSGLTATYDDALNKINLTVTGAIGGGTPEGWFNVKDYGATGDGSTDDTTSINNALAAAAAATYGANNSPSGYGVTEGTAGALYFPPGQYVYNGTGLSAATKMLQIIGAGREHVRIKLGASSFFVQDSTISDFTMRGLEIVGGLGAVKFTMTTGNVRGTYIVEDCIFEGYTQCAIGHTSSDMPYWKIRDCIFYGANNTTTIGVALGGLTDESSVSENAFLRNKYHIKVTECGNNLKIVNNDLIRYATGTELTDIWIVPRTGNTNNGFGLEIYGNKFGNENSSSDNMKILIADEGATALDGGATIDRTTKGHSTANSSARLEGFTIERNNFSFGGSPAKAIITCYTTDLRHWQFLDNMVQGSPPPAIIDGPQTLTDNRLNCTGFIRLGAHLYDGTEQAMADIDPKGYAGIILDPLGFSTGLPGVLTPGPGRDSAYTDIVATGNPNTASISGSITRAGATDLAGGSNAATVTYASSGDYIYWSITAANLQVGELHWIEVDLGKAASLSLNSVYVQAVNSSSGIALRRVLFLSPNQRTVRIPWRPRQNTTNLELRIAPHNFSAGVRTKVIIGRPRVYR